MRLSPAWIAFSWALSPETTAPSFPSPTTSSSNTALVSTSTATASPASSSSVAFMSRTTSSIQSGPALWLSSAAVSVPPSEQDVELLRSAFAEFYGQDGSGGVARDYTKSDALLTQTVQRWEATGQPGDELAGLYRVRGDCRMNMSKAADAVADYSKAIKLLQQDPAAAAAADPTELPSALLGRARSQKALRSTDAVVSKQTAADYEQALKLTSREEWDTAQENLEDGASRNPYATWEWADTLRSAGEYKQAATAHLLAAEAFDATGDRGRSVISQLDAGIDLASASDKASNEEAKVVLNKAIALTKGVTARDVTLLQRTIAKESEARTALAALLWNDGDRVQAETNLGEACIRLDQLQADAAGRKNVVRTDPVAPLPYSIDDSAPLEMTCPKFKNPAYLTNLGWSESLQKKVINLETLR